MHSPDGETEPEREDDFPKMQFLVVKGKNWRKYKQAVGKKSHILYSDTDPCIY